MLDWNDVANFVVGEVRSQDFARWRQPLKKNNAVFFNTYTFQDAHIAPLLDELSADPICHTFELGGAIAALGDVAFVRDEITERGLDAVFSGDNSLVLFRLQPRQDGLLSPSPAL